jgi:hypothetical protein
MISRTTRDIMFTNEINELILHEKTSTKNKHQIVTQIGKTLHCDKI